MLSPTKAYERWRYYIEQPVEASLGEMQRAFEVLSPLSNCSYRFAARLGARMQRQERMTTLPTLCSSKARARR
jgi:hypothetical protein